MDRRVEVEKKERYGQLLREQIAADAARRKSNKEDSDGETPTHQSASTFAFPDGALRGTIGGDSFSPPRAHGPLGSRSATDFNRREPSVGRLTTLPPCPGSGGRSATASVPPSVSAASAFGGETWGTADQVAQVQDMMRQRIKHVEDQQLRQMSQIQKLVDDRMASMREAAEQAMQRQVGALVEGQAAELRSAMEHVAALQRESSAQTSRMHGVAEEVSSLRREMAQLDADRSSQQTTLADHTAKIETLMRDHEDCRRFRLDVQREQREQDEAIAQLRAEQGVLKQRLDEVPGQLQRLKDEMQRIAERVAHDVMGRMRPEPAPSPPLPALPPAMPDVSEEAYAVLRHEDELYELPALKNAVGRSPACEVRITCSQAISNKHMTVDFDRDGRVHVRDLGSRNGTFLNDRRVPEDAGLVLDSGDAIQMGVDGPSYVFEFGPAYYARWPREPERIKGLGHRGASPRARGPRAGSTGPGRGPAGPRAK